ncbi:MAG: S8 family serine peptidase, partial [Lysobacter sp.]
PGAYSDVLAVTAVDRHLKPWARAARGSHIALAAPGVAIWSADVRGDGRFHNGTSFASPFAAAAAAVIKQRSPALSAQQIADRLRHDARDLGVAGPDPVFGAGLVQLPRCR